MDAEFAQLTKAIKGIVKNYLENEKLSDVAYATYTGSSLVIDKRPVPVPLDMVDIPQHLLGATGKVSLRINKVDAGEGLQALMDLVGIDHIEIKDIEFAVQRGLAPGARVAVVQKRGANKYSIIDEVTGV